MFFVTNLSSDFLMLSNTKTSLCQNLPCSYKKIPDSVPADAKTLLQKFPSILRNGDVNPTPTHGVEHHIHTGSHPPVFANFHCLDPEKLQIAKAEFKRLESAGIIRWSKSPWASPLHMVSKKRWIMAAFWRLSPFKFGDNPGQVSFTKHARPFQRSALLHNVFLVKGYHQIPVVTEDIRKNCNKTPFGLFEYLFTPFVMSNAAQTFQRMMDPTTDDLKGVFVYMDDS
jgi:hypothetical protein